MLFKKIKKAGTTSQIYTSHYVMSTIVHVEYSDKKKLSFSVFQYSSRFHMSLSFQKKTDYILDICFWI